MTRSVNFLRYETYLAGEEPFVFFCNNQYGLAVQ